MSRPGPLGHLLPRGRPVCGRREAGACPRDSWWPVVPVPVAMETRAHSFWSWDPRMYPTVLANSPFCFSWFRTGLRPLKSRVGSSHCPSTCTTRVRNLDLQIPHAPHCPCRLTRTLLAGRWFLGHGRCPGEPRGHGWRGPVGDAESERLLALATLLGGPRPGASEARAASSAHGQRVQDSGFAFRRPCHRSKSQAHSPRGRLTQRADQAKGVGWRKPPSPPTLNLAPPPPPPRASPGLTSRWQGAERTLGRKEQVDGPALHSACARRPRLSL